MLLEVSQHEFPRCGLPEEFEKGILVCCFFDGSGSTANSRVFLKAKSVTYFAGTTHLAQLGPLAAPQTECEAQLMGLWLTE